MDARRNRWLSACLVASVVSVMAGAASAGTETMKPETLERVKRAAVMVFTAYSRNAKGDTPYSSGSGYFINGTGMFITNDHVATPWHGKPDGEAFQMKDSMGTISWQVITDSGTDDEKTWPCRMVYRNDPADQAILQALDEEGVNLESPDFLRLLPESRLHVRKNLWAFGFPGGDSQKSARGKHPEITVTQGRITDLPRKASGRIEMIWTDVNINHGSSGGPMVDADGYLVGTSTLGTIVAGRSNTSMLVPSELTRRFVQRAFVTGKVVAGSDFTPFMDVLTTDSGRINVPEFSRLKDREALFFEGGDRIYGKVATEKITWDSDMGAFEIPLDAAAYVMTNDEGSNLYLEGGNRISASEAGATLTFRADDGGTTEQDLDEVQVASFRTSDRRLEPIVGEVVVLDADLAYLVLDKPKGRLKFESNNAGVMDVLLQDISRIETTPDEDQLLIMRDGRRITGMFTEDPIEARIAATGVPLRFHLAEIGEATIEVETRGLNDVAGLGLRGALAGGSRDVLRLAAQVDAMDRGDVRTKIAKLTEPATLKGFPVLRRDRLVLLEGVAALRDGDYDLASRSLAKAGRSRNKNIEAYSKACVDVLRRFKDHTYQGRGLSDRMAFASAGRTLAGETIGGVRGFLKFAPRFHRLKPNEFRAGNYARNMVKIRQFEREMTTADVLGGIEAEAELHKLWLLGTNSCEGETFRLQDAIRKIQQENQNPRGGNARRSGRGGGRRGGGGARLASQREIDDLTAALEKVAKARQALDDKMRLEAGGFQIIDPDNDALIRDRERDDGP